jgi:hypothetical protein
MSSSSGDESPVRRLLVRPACKPWLLAVAVVLAFASFGQPLRANASATPVVRGGLVMQGPASSVQQITLASDTQLDLRDPTTSPVAISGLGRLSGLALASDSFFLLAYSYQFCWESACAPDQPRQELITLPPASGGMVTIPAGTYDAYLIADGPTSATLKLNGGPLTRLSGGLPAPLHIASGQNDLGGSVTPMGGAFKGGSVGQIADRGVILDIVSWVGSASQNGAYGACVYSGDPPPVAYAPECPAASAGFNGTTIQGSDHSSTAYFAPVNAYAQKPLSAGRIALGGYFVSGGSSVAGFGQTAMWLNLRSSGASAAQPDRATRSQGSAGTMRSTKAPVRPTNSYRSKWVE